MPDDISKKDLTELRALLRRIEDRSKKEPIKRREPVQLEKAVPGTVVTTERGMCYVIEDDACKFLEPQDEFTSVTDLYFRRGQVNLEYLQSHEMLSDLADVAAEKILFLDIETAGLHGMGLFLIGLLLFEDGRFRVKQLFARDYAEEAAVLEYLREFYSKSKAIVTFNGRAFDLPFIADRAVIHRVPLKRPRIDVDLLPAARRIWKTTLPNCKLSTLEQFVCGRRRVGDVPSHLIPQVYHEFVENGDAYLITDVVRHNAYDLITMAHLLARMVNG